MNRSTSFKLWEARFRLFLRRAAVWLSNYFALNHPLNWPPAVQTPGPKYNWRMPNQPPERRAPAGNLRSGISYFYTGTLAGSFLSYFLLGGQVSAQGPLNATDFQWLAGIALALLLYPAIHRLGRFDDVRTVIGSLLVSGMFGFIVPLIFRVVVG